MTRYTRSSQHTNDTLLSPGSPLRIAGVLIFLALIALVLVGRVVYLSLIAGPANAETAVSQRTQIIDVSARRGTIYDRNGNVLATTIDATTIYCNPNEVIDAHKDAQSLSSVLGGNEEDYYDALTKKNSSFAYLSRKVDKDVADQVKDLDLDGIYFLPDSKRVYPNGQTAGQIVGLTDIDGKGVSGLELYYDDILSGEDGQMQVERGGNGYAVAGGITETKPAVNGQDIVVSIDLEMQEYLEQRTSQAVSELEGKRGDAVLYDGATGEVVAIASTPYLNPQDRSSVEEGATSLLPINTSYEPGSIFKGVTMAAILEAEVLSPTSELYAPEHLYADGYSVSDAHARAAQMMSLTEILAQSSNVGTSLAAKELGFKPLYDKIQQYGLTKVTGIDFPGESKGYLADQSAWSLVQSYNVSFGQGVMVTPLQMARFYGALRNDGVAQTPHFLVSKPQSNEIAQYQSEQIIENTNAIEPLTTMLEAVVTQGTGKKAHIEGYSVAGKTGTAQYADDAGSYTPDKYNISFIGYLPNSSSKLVCFVGVTEVPGDRQTASAFKDIMSFAINHYQITAQ